MAVLIGTGAFGKVYKETVNGVVCAVKKIIDYDSDDLKEVKLFESVRHKYIIKPRTHYFEDCVMGESLNLVMEYGDIGTLTSFTTEQVKRMNTVKEKSVWNVTCHLSEALDYLHSRFSPILHRDVKPDNVLGVTDPSTGAIMWKLADFGLATEANRDFRGRFFTSTTVGTPIYMAPEVN